MAKKNCTYTPEDGFYKGYSGTLVDEVRYRVGGCNHYDVEITHEDNQLVLRKIVTIPLTFLEKLEKK